MAYNIIKSHKKTGFHPFLRRYIFWKNDRGCQIEPSSNLLRVKEINKNFKFFIFKTSFFKKLYPKVLFIMPGANCIFPQCGVARYHVGAGIFKLPTRNC